ncbi:MAG: 5-formyltetrahydrofolate cyclo-ligase [Burkholderiales bacterium]|nr:5-formyltetrahydrofolate cyclo-ligase [Burkholderiales bacterium]
MSVERKKLLRKELFAIRKSSAENKESVTSIQRRLYGKLTSLPYKSLGFYWAIKTEPKITPAVLHWLADSSDHLASLPSTEQDPMRFRLWNPGIEVKARKFSALEPTSSRFTLPELLIIPCLGFDSQKYRLGYGAGWYDRYLASRNGDRPYTIGIAFEECHVDTIYPDSFDIPLDEIITQSEDLA